jgi:FixJ family two-component response regulator
MMAETPFIVVVDDDPGMNQALERLLGAAGLRVRTFPSSEALLASDAIPHASCLVLDIGLPGLSGLDLQLHLAATGVILPVIFITGQDHPLHRQKAVLAGADYLTKPFPGSELLRAVRRHLPAA